MNTYKRMMPALIKGASDYTSISVAAIMSKARTRHLCRIRFAIMWVARNRLGLTLSRIKEELKMSDHSTVHNGLKRAEELRANNIAFLNLIDYLIFSCLEDVA